MNPKPKTALMTPRLMLFMATMILANLAGQMHEPLMPLYLQELGADVGQVGLFFTLGAIAPLAFQILGGWLSDSIGRLQAIAIGSVSGALGYVVYVVAPSWQWLLLTSLSGALAFSFVAPSYMAFVAEESGDQARGRVYGLSQTLFMVVSIAGPPLGGYLSQRFGFRILFAVAGLMYALATVVRLAMARDARRTETVARERPSWSHLKSSLGAMGALLVAGGVVTWIFVSDGIRDTTFRMAFQLLPLYLQNEIGLSNLQIGWLSSAYGVASMIFLAPAGWLSDRLGERVGIVAGFALIALSLALFLNSGEFVGLVVVWAVFGIGGALVDPAYNSLISKTVPEHLRGTAFGLFTTSIGIISLPAPYIGALLWERFTPQLPFYLPLIATVVLLPVMWVKFHLPDRDTGDAVQEGIPQ